jgi:hypothetical protein
VRYLKAAIALALLGALWAAAPASAEVKWWTKAEWGPTTLAPGGKGQLVIHTRNYGRSPSELPAGKIVDQLPAGVIATAIKVVEGINWNTTDTPRSDASCSGVGSSAVNCQMSGYVEGLGKGQSSPGFGIIMAGPTLWIDVRVSPSATGTGTNTVTLSGGGDPTPAVEVNQIPFGQAPEEFGVNASGWIAHPGQTNDVFDTPFPADGAPYRQAGGHPGDLRLAFDFNERYEAIATDPSDTFLNPIGRARTISVTLPRGLIGNPEAAPKCKQLDFLAKGQEPFEATGCPPNTQLGTLDVITGRGALASGGQSSGNIGSIFNRVAIYNLEPPKGTPIDLGYQIGEFASGHIYASLDPAHDYAIRATSPYVNQVLPLRSVRVTQWGVPADPAHDIFRAPEPVLLASELSDQRAPAFGAPFEGQVKPFFTNPSDCGVDNGGLKISVDSWNDPGNFTQPIEAENHLNVTGCDDQRIRFHPDISLQPTSRAAGGPTGLKVDLEVPQRDQTVEDYEELYSENGALQGIETPPIKESVVTLPEGMTLSTSAAEGLTGCSSAQIGLGTNDPVTCPDSSQYGELAIHTPLLPEDEPMRGYIYIAKQGDNPFRTFLALYLVIEDQDRGLRIKLPARIDLDPLTGQIITTFDDLPQFPVSDLELSLKGGVRAGLVNPPTCGAKQITATFYSWAAPDTPITRTSSYDITQKGDGSPCPNSLGERGFAPQMSAGTESNAAGRYSPFHFRITRSDDDQEFSQLGVTLPPGLLAKIAGLSKCPEAGIAQAIARTAAGDGTLEVGNPSCPASSQIGTTNVGTGVGQVITYIPGRAYLAGPYKGAPLSMVVITPILAGPYDLGVVAVRSAIYVNGELGQATVKTDPFPQIYQGIPVRIRDIRVSVDRPEVTLNPTNCEPMAVQADVTGVGGDLYSTADDAHASAQSRFQAADCASLPFKPSLRFKLSGATRRAGFPALTAVLRGRPGDANIARTQVVLPNSEFVEQGHIRTLCTRPQFATDTCPAGSVYGYASAKSPLFDGELAGPVYLRSNGGARILPDLVAHLSGEVDVVLAGFIDSVNGRLRTSFDVIPDAPVTRFTLQMEGGKRGLLVNHLDLCQVTARASVRMWGQNGKRSLTHPKMGTSCKHTAGRHGR